MAIYYNKKTKKYDCKFSVNGRQYMMRGFDSEAEALANERDHKDLLFNHPVKQSKIMFHTIVRLYIKEEVSHYKPSSAYVIQLKIKSYILDLFEDKEYRLITYVDFLNWHEKLNKTNYREKTRILFYLKKIVNLAAVRTSIDHIRWVELLPRFKNYVKRPVQRTIYDMEQIKMFLSAFNDDLYYKCLFCVFGFCGLRTGELRGLTWDDSVDLEKGLIYVFKEIATINGSSVVLVPKSKSSQRYVPIPGFLNELLKQLRESSSFNKTGQYVFHGFNRVSKPVNAPIGVTSIRRRKLEACEGRLPFITNHELRHSFASILNNLLGVNSQTIAELLGHSSKSVTENVYLHSSENKKRDAIDKLDAHFKDLLN